MALSNFDRYQRIAWAYDFLDLPFEYARYRKIRPQPFCGLAFRIGGSLVTRRHGSPS